MITDAEWRLMTYWERARYCEKRGFTFAAEYWWRLDRECWR